MHAQLKQVLGLSIFGLICCVFVFRVPRGDAQPSSVEEILDTTSDQKFDSALSLLSFSGELTILADQAVVNTGLIQLLEHFSTDYGVTYQLQSQKDLKSDAFSGFDLLLWAYDQHTLLSGKTLALSQDISQFFLPEVAKVMWGESSAFIPYLLDPLVVALLADAEGVVDFTTRADTRTPKNALANLLLPPSVDHATAQERTHALAYNFLLQELVATNNIGGLRSLIEQTMLPIDAQRLLKAMASQKDCEGFPEQCLMAKGFLGAGLIFASVAREKGLQTLDFPTQQTRPARLYARWINPDSPQFALAQQFMLTYLQLPADQLQNLAPQSDFLSPFLELQSQNALQEQELEIISPLHWLRLKAFPEPLLQKVLEKKLNPDLYLERVSL